VRLLDANPLRTRPHWNSASPGVEVRGPQTLGGISVAGAIAATTAVVAVILLTRLL
jgi:hypothetical protein